MHRLFVWMLGMMMSTVLYAQSGNQYLVVVCDAAARQDQTEIMPWDRQLRYVFPDGLRLETSKDYLVSARIKATSSFQTQLRPRTADETEFYIGNMVDVTTEWDTIEWYLQSSEMIDGVRERDLALIRDIRFPIGDLTGRFFIDDVAIREVGNAGNPNLIPANSSQMTGDASGNFGWDLVVYDDNLREHTYFAAEYDYIDIDFSNPIVGNSCQGASGTMQFSGSGFEIGFNNGNETLCPGVLRLGNGTASVEFLPGGHDIVTISFDLWIGKLVNSEVEFGVLDMGGNRIGGARIIKWTNKGLFGYSDFGDIQSTIIDGPQYASDNDGIHSDAYKNTVTLTFDFVHNSMKAQVLNGLGGSVETEETAMLSAQQMKSFFIRTNYDISNRRCWFDNLRITSEASTQISHQAQYTIRRMCGSLRIADDIVAQDIAGSRIILSDSDRPAQLTYDGDVYYYVDDDAARQTINANGSTLITVNYRKESTYDYTLQAVNANGDLLQVLESGTFKESAPISRFYPRAILHNGIYYGIGRNGADPYYGLRINDGVNSLTYTPLNPQPAYYSEIEDMNLHLSTAGHGSGWMGNPNAPQRYSEGRAYRLNYSQYVSTPALSAGLYRLELYARNPKSNSLSGIGVRVSNATGTVTFPAIEFDAWGSYNCSEHSITHLMVPEGYSLQIAELNNSNNELELDFVIVYKEGDIASISSSANLQGWKNFYDAQSNWQVDANTRIYQVTSTDETTYEVTRIDGQIIPKANPVLLRTSNDIDHRISMLQVDDNAASASDGLFTFNRLQASTIPLQSMPLATTFRFGYVNGVGIGFFTVSQVPANMPYLSTGSQSPEFRIIDDEEESTTAIETLPAGGNAVSYDLSGQPCSRPSGLVIVNGSKQFIHP